MGCWGFDTGLAFLRRYGTVVKHGIGVDCKRERKRESYPQEVQQSVYGSGTTVDSLCLDVIP